MPPREVRIRIVFVLVAATTVGGEYDLIDGFVVIEVGEEITRGEGYVTQIVSVFEGDDFDSELIVSDDGVRRRGGVVVVMVIMTALI